MTYIARQGVAVSPWKHTIFQLGAHWRGSRLRAYGETIEREPKHAGINIE